MHLADKQTVHRGWLFTVAVILNTNVKYQLYNGRRKIAMILNSSSPRMRLFQLKCPHRFGSGTPLVMMPLQLSTYLTFLWCLVHKKTYKLRYKSTVAMTEIIIFFDPRNDMI